jgi:hypothetical protein
LAPNFGKTIFRKKRFLYDLKIKIKNLAKLGHIFGSALSEDYAEQSYLSP